MIATSRTRKSVLVRPPDPQAIDGLHQRTLSRYRPSADPLPGGIGQHLVDPLVMVELGELGESRPPGFEHRIVGVSADTLAARPAVGVRCSG